VTNSSARAIASSFALAVKAAVAWIAFVDRCRVHVFVWAQAAALSARSKFCHGKKGAPREHAPILCVDARGEQWH
jgi:hypothetical protein